jgi:glycosyltransferase involved in cell wall biosynthesis
VVDDGSDDDTAALAEKAGARGRCCMEPSSPPWSPPLRTPYRPIA